MDEISLPALMLLGPTASGKSALAMRLAEAVPLEIISVDSAQVYRGLDIGSAKPNAIERARVKHHLIDVREPNEAYSAADFVRDATAAINSIHARERLPLLVGGTMLYAKALLEGLSDLPSADSSLRAELAAQGREMGWPALHARLARIDPATAARLAPNDSQRIQRALEIWLLSGQTMSALLERPRPTPRSMQVVRLMPDDRAELHRRIAKRFDSMLEAGFIDEVRGLRARGDLGPQSPSMRSVGYRQAWQHLEGATSMDEFRAAAVAATRQFAKRQLTWLRSMADAAAVDPFADARFSTIERLAISIASA